MVKVYHSKIKILIILQIGIQTVIGINTIDKHSMNGVYSSCYFYNLLLISLEILFVIFQLDF